MEDEFEDLLSSCSAIDFGSIDISPEEEEFCSDLNREIILLCKSLPESAQTDALLFLMNYSRISFGEDLDFFKHYYAPVWSVLYWLIRRSQEGEGLEQIEMRNAKTAHSMAMFLHSLDDHLNDNQLPASHMALLLRSQSWMIMRQALSSLADKVDGGEEIVQSFIGDYYSGICGSTKIDSLGNYCDLFRKLMAMGLIVPALITRKISSDEGFTDAVLKAYGSFGIAWRLLDDLQDIREDMAKGVYSSVYVCLPEKLRDSWNGDGEEKKDWNGGYSRLVLSYVRENGVIDRIRDRIYSELEFAVSTANRCRMSGLAGEFRALLRPLENAQEHL
jgi:hypothetical protein